MGTKLVQKCRKRRRCPEIPLRGTVHPHYAIFPEDWSRDGRWIVFIW